MKHYTKELLVFLLGVGVVLIVYAYVTDNGLEDEPAASTMEEAEVIQEGGGLTIFPVSHASGVLRTEGRTIVMDPVGDPARFGEMGDPDIILLTDIHGDHLSVETLEALVNEETTIIAPEAVYDELSEVLRAQTEVLQNGESTDLLGFTIEAVRMYNLPETSESRHVKGRGNGYIIEAAVGRIYIAGDTDGIPEMRNLEGIQFAFIPMNPPYTMDVEEAADAVLDFAPKEVYPYHYRTPDGLSDINKFKELVNAGNPDINVVLLDWYNEEATGE